jgi:hypothetical protein
VSQRYEPDNGGLVRSPPKPRFPLARGSKHPRHRQHLTPVERVVYRTAHEQPVKLSLGTLDGRDPLALIEGYCSSTDPIGALVPIPD